MKDRKMRVAWYFKVTGILFLGLTSGITCKKHNLSTLSFTATFGGSLMDWGNSAQQTSDGGYVITGYTYSSGAGYTDLWLVKTDAFGNRVWDKTFGGSSYDEGHAVQQTTDGGYIVTGYTESSGAGWRDVWLIKTDADGNKVWDKTFGGQDDDESFSVQQTSDGGYIIVGYAASGHDTSEDIWLIKTDASGNKVWDQTFGGSGYYRGASVEQTNDGGYILTAFTAEYGAGNHDVWLIRTDASGSKVWDKTFGGTADDGGYSVRQTSDGGYIVAGWTNSRGAGGQDAWLIKTDSSGNEVWDKTFGGTGGEAGYSVQQTLDGGYIITGRTESYGEGQDDVWLVKTDSSGNKVWDKTFGGRDDDAACSVQQTSDGGFIMTGGTESYGAGDYDVWLIKTDADGN